MKLQFVLFFSLIAFSCNQNKSKVNPTTETVQKTIEVTKSDISKLNFTDYVLDSKSEKAINDWKSYPELEVLITDVQNGNLSYFKNNHEVISAFVKDFKNSIPLDLNTNAIKARILALETTLLKLENAVNLSFDKQKLLLVIKEFFVANANLKLQINKKLEKESQRIDKPN